MKHILFFFLIGIFTSCSTTHINDQWKNPDIDVYEANKVLIVGMTPNVEARKQFEMALKQQYEARGIEAVMSLDLFEPNFTTEEKSEAELKRIENILLANGFDTVLFSKVVGVKDKTQHSNLYKIDKLVGKHFSEDYLEHQDVYYKPDYYKEYIVYKAETALYCICPTKERELIWKGYIDVVDPGSIKETVKDYVKLLIYVLEDQQLLTKDKIKNVKA